MTTTVAEVVTGRASMPRRALTPGQLAWRRFARNRLAVVGAGWTALILLIAIIGPWIAPHSYAATDYAAAMQGPSWAHPFGTDTLGHDMFSEILYSIRFSMEIAVGATLIAFVIGAILGLWAGMAGGLADALIMRVVDFMFAFPSYFLNLILVIDLGRGLFPIFLSIGLTQWAGYARLIRGLVLGLRQSEMAEAARCLGATPGHLARYYMFPNVLNKVLIALAFGFPYAMIQDAALSVVGMGLRPPMPSFGNLLAAGGGNALGFPWLLWFPATIFGITLLSILFVGDGLQEALDPRGSM
jgi:peptide/nickel transport system permease protein